jgi:hypothetical protein
MATRDQLEELDRKMFWECKQVLGFHGSAAAHHIMSEVEDDGGLDRAFADADVEKIKISIEKAPTMYGGARTWLNEMVETVLIEEEDSIDLESRVFNLAAFMEAYLALGFDSDLGFDECGCIKDLDKKIKWEDWRFPWLHMPIKEALEMELKG